MYIWPKSRTDTPRETKISRNAWAAAPVRHARHMSALQPYAAVTTNTFKPQFTLPCEIVVRATTQVNGKREIRPLATPKRLNRSLQKVAHVITSWISTDVQNLVAIPPGVSFPLRANLRIKMFTRLFFPGSSNSLQSRRLNRFSRVIRQTTQFRARMCLFGVRRQKFNIYTP